MEQLPLEVRLHDHAVFGNFHPAGNEAVLHALEAAATGDGPHLVWLWGPPGSGRTHLLQATVVAADDRGRRSAHVPLDRSLGLPPAVLDGLGADGLVSLDDFGQVAGDPAWEGAVFRLYEQLHNGGGTLVVAAAGPPASVGVALPDLASRLASGPVFRVRPLDDEALLAAMRMRAGFRGFELPEETGRYLLARRSRRPADLFALLDRLDRAGLAARKRLTIPFVRAVMGGEETG